MNSDAEPSGCVGRPAKPPLTVYRGWSGGIRRQTIGFGGRTPKPFPGNRCRL